MKKSLITLLLLLIFSFLLIGVTSCSGEEPEAGPVSLAAPENVRVEKRVVIWDADPKAVVYKVRVDGEEYETKENRFPLYSMTAEGGEYIIDVAACGDGRGYLDSTRTRITVELERPLEHGYDESGLEYTFLYERNGYEVSRGRVDLVGVVTIPDTFGEFPVVHIADYAFCIENSYNKNCFTESDCNKVTTGVILPSMLESIGHSSFGYMVRLEEICIPDSVTYLGVNAFYGCTHMTKLKLPKNLKEIPFGGFENTALSEIILPETLEFIGTWAFGCEYWDVGSRVYHIDSDLSSITIPPSVKMIYGAAFQGRENLGTVNIPAPENIEEMQIGVFYGTPWFDSQPDGFIQFGCLLYQYKGDAPNGCLMDLPSDVTKIAGGAIADVDNLQKVTVREGIKFIGHEIFARCDVLSEVTLPADLEYIPQSTFISCRSLKSITIPDTVTRIDQGAFLHSGLESIIIPPSVKELGDRVFGMCEALVEVNFSEGLEIIGRETFQHCKQLARISLPNTVKSLGPSCFASTALETVVIPSSVEYIDWGVFYQIDNLTRVYFEADKERADALIAEKNSDTEKKLFSDAQIFYYSEEEPSESGNYWHYVDGVPVAW